jgi:hypothetical protein
MIHFNHYLSTKLLLLGFCCMSSWSFSQHPLWGFTIPTSMKLVDTIQNGQSTVYSYEDINDRDILQETYYSGRRYEINYFKNSTNETFHIEFDSLSNVVGYGHKTGRTLIGYDFYSNGTLKWYQQATEDTLAQKFAYTDDSFMIQFHPNGVIKTRYYCSNSIQEYKEYWPNGNLKIVADFLADALLFCGKYREYDEQGKLAITGYYRVDEYQVDMIKCGTWTYYANGRKAKKERF